MSNTKTRTRKAPAVTAEQLHETIARQVEQLRDSGAWERYLDFGRSLHAYSFSNLMLAMAQKPDATGPLAGFRKWQSLGRQVRRGEKGIRIFAFSTKKVTETDPKTGEETTRTVSFFPVVSVFDITQTEPIPGAEPLPELGTELTGTDDHGVIDLITGTLVADGWTVTTNERLPHDASGMTAPDQRLVVTRESLAPAMRAKTLIHELAHIVLGHVEDHDAYRTHRGVMETEAESTAYIVAGMFGLDTAAYSIGYIAGWADADVDLIRSTASRVITAAHRIHQMLTGDTDPAPAPADQTTPTYQLAA
jgi:hypothetical protein